MVAGLFDGRRLALEDVYRFENGGTLANAGCTGTCWPNGPISCRACGRRRQVRPAGGQRRRRYVGRRFRAARADDELLGNPYHYRDRRTNGMMDEAFSIVTREEIFRTPACSSWSSTRCISCWR